MASNKTEKASPKKLRDARKQGQVAKSKEVVATVLIGSILFWIWIKGADIFIELEKMVLLPAELYNVPFEVALRHLITGILSTLIAILLPVMAVVVLAAVAGNFVQHGFLFTTKPVTPNFKHLNPAEGFKRIFSVNTLIELLKSIVKILVLGLLLYGVIRDSIDPLLKLPLLGLDDVLPVFSAIFAKICIITIIAFTAVAAADLAWQRYHFQKKQMMSKDEVKREYKEMEGDPIIKGKRRQLQREIANSNTLAQARKASFLVTNPTHLAVAMFYDDEKTKLPLVLAKGEGLIARRMMELARDEDIPVVRNVPLARDLYENVPIDHYIPADLIEPVAEILRWLREMK